MTAPKSRRILLVAYHYGPGCPTGGFRWTEMVPKLAERGWEFDIVTLARSGTGTGLQPGPTPAAPVEVWEVEIPAAYRAIARLSGNVPDQLASILRRRRRAAAPEAGAPGDHPVDPGSVHVARRGHQRSLRQGVVASLTGISEAALDRGWAKSAYALGRKLCRLRPYGAIVVSSPPHLTQWTGAALSRATGVPFIPDLRDPWLMGIGASRANANPVHRFLAARFEPSTYRRAAVVVHNTQRALEAVQADADGIEVRRTAIPNGYDDIGPVGSPDPAHFIVAYTGTLHPWMDIRPVFAACQRLCAENPHAAASLRIRFMGVSPDFGGVSLTGLAQSYGLGRHFELLPRGSREEAARLQQTAAVLVAFDCTHPLCVPTKFYDYARLRGTMLLLGHEEGAMADAAAEIGVRVHPLDSGAAGDALARGFERWARGGPFEPQDPDGRFHRSVQAARWDELLRSVTGQG